MTLTKVIDNMFLQYTSKYIYLFEASNDKDFDQLLKKNYNMYTCIVLYMKIVIYKKYFYRYESCKQFVF